MEGLSGVIACPGLVFVEGLVYTAGLNAQFWFVAYIRFFDPCTFFRFMYLQVPSLEKYQIVPVLMIWMIFNRTQCLRQSDLTVYVTVAYLIYIWFISTYEWGLKLFSKYTNACFCPAFLFLPRHRTHPIGHICWLNWQCKRDRSCLNKGDLWGPQKKPAHQAESL